jgi:predicted neuraminidase
MKYNSQAKEYIFEENRPFLSCHASTLVVLPNGEVLCAYFAGTKEKHSDVAIWSSRRTGEGEWLKPVKVADEAHIAHWNPVLFQNPQGMVFLYYKVGHEITEWYTMAMSSQDGGRTWTSPQALVEGDLGGRGPVKNKPILLSNGAILAPASIEAFTDWHGFNRKWDAFTDISYDGGLTWKKSLVPLNYEELQRRHARQSGSIGVIQPTLWESAGGRVHMLLRSTSGSVYRSDSQDFGETWCEAYATDLPNNNSGIDAVKIDNGDLALVYNPVSAKGVRTPLVVRFSSDNGETWKDEIILEQEPGEYSYPAIVARGNELFITYTWRRERIAFWHLSD